MVGVPGARRRAGRVRLSRSADFERVFRQGRSHAGRELVLYVFPRGEATEGDAPRLGLSVSRKVGGAVQRNREACLERPDALSARRGHRPARVTGTLGQIVARKLTNSTHQRHDDRTVDARFVLGETIADDGEASIVRESRDVPVQRSGRRW